MSEKRDSRGSDVAAGAGGAPVQAFCDVLPELLDQSSIVAFVWRVAPGWPVEYVSDAIRQFGYEPAEFIGGALTYAAIMHPEDIARVELEMDRVIEEGSQRYSVAYRIRTRGGQERWLEERGLVRRDREGRATHFHGLVIDITRRREAEVVLTRYHERLAGMVTDRTRDLEAANRQLEAEAVGRREAEQAWRESAALYQTITEAFDGMICICSSEHRLEFLNRRMIARLGRDATGEPCHPVMDKLGLPCHACDDALQAGDTVRCESQSLRDGCWYLSIHSPVRRAGGRSSTIAMILDITERKKAELALRESEDRYRRLLGSVTDYVYEVDVRDGQAVRTRHGPGCEAVTGYSMEDFARSPYLWLHMVFPEDRSAVLRQAEQVFSGREPEPVEHRIVTRNGVVRWVRNTMVPRRDAAGALAGYDGLIKDITERRQAEVERLEMERRILQARQNELMERTARLSSLGLLAAGIAHEVNNPLQGMLSHLAALKTALPVDFPRRASVEMVERAVESIAGLVQRLLWMGTADTDRTPRTSFRQAVDFVQNLLQTSFEKSRVRIEVHPPSRDPILAIPQRELVQVMLNLMINARDAMPGGGTVSIGFETQGSEGVVTISDTGTGIPKDVIPNIFTPFFTTKGRCGTGIGLSVVESLVQACNGRIAVDSTMGQGSVFRIWIPLAEATA